jgi:hypothetical protein
MQKGIELAKEAVEEDKKQNWQAALDLYKRSLEYFTTHLKYDKNPKSRQMITNKVRQMREASLRGLSHSCHSSHSADVRVAGSLGGVPSPVAPNCCSPAAQGVLG